MFIVQGEGRGHMTQALALEQILIKAGHQVGVIAVGTSSRREIPNFFKEKTTAFLQPLESPNFYYDRDSKSINLWKTLLLNLIRTPLYLRQLLTINKLRKQHQPDLIVNFYDLLGGFYFLLFRPKVGKICIAHQYMAKHSSFPFAKAFPTQKTAFKLNNYITSFNTDKILALSFRKLESEDPKMRIVPPLLRKEVLDLSGTKGDYILAYVVNKGYGEEIMHWHAKNRKIKLHCFWDNKAYEDGWKPHENLTFHHINDKKFLALMKDCLGYASTAGFESICEAMYLEKPVLMVPVKGQYEQACNAEDAILAQAGIKSKKFKLGKLLNLINQKQETPNEFKEWITGYEQIFLKELESLKKVKNDYSATQEWNDFELSSSK